MKPDIIFCSAGTHGNTCLLTGLPRTAYAVPVKATLASVRDEKWNKGHEAGFPKDIHHVPCLFMSTTAFLSPYSVLCVFQSEFLMIEVELMRKLLEKGEGKWGKTQRGFLYLLSHQQSTLVLQSFHLQAPFSFLRDLQDGHCKELPQ